MIDIHHLTVHEIRIDTTIKADKSNTYFIKGIPPKPPRPKTIPQKDSTQTKIRIYGKKH